MENGTLRKMKTTWLANDKTISYHLRLQDQEIPVNEWIGHKLKLRYTGQIHCIHCGRKTKKSFQQGYCYPCTQKLAETDFCILKPELCHHHWGTCRDNEFAQSQCFIPHTVYLANCGSEKVGITRSYQKLTRWADQGASEALELATVPHRKASGDLEVFLKNHISDRTNWRKMLSAQIPLIDLVRLKASLVQKLPDEYQQYVIEAEPYQLIYPTQAFPSKMTSFDLEKNSIIEDQLIGIKGQYLIFENGVINLRKYQGYEVEVLI